MVIILDGQPRVDPIIYDDGWDIRFAEDTIELALKCRGNDTTALRRIRKILKSLPLEIEMGSIYHTTSSFAPYFRGMVPAVKVRLKLKEYGIFPKGLFYK